MAKRPRATAKEAEEIQPRLRPVQQRAKDTVQRVLETAAELVDEVGVVGFNTNLLAERAGIRIRTIYRYFPNKLGILSELMQHLNEESEERLRRRSELGNPENDWRELVGNWIDEVTTWTRKRPGARLLMGWAHNVPELLAVEDRLDEESTHIMMDALRARGVDLPPERLYAISRNFNEALDKMTSLAARDDQPFADDLIEETHRMLVRYLELYLD